LTLSYFMELVISGVVTGCSYALIGAGLSLIWGTLKMVNLAHGEYYMLGGYFLWSVWTQMNMGVPLILAIAISLVGVALVAILLHMTTVRPLISKPGWEMSPWVLTLGIQILLQNLALILFSELYQNVPYFWDVVLHPFNGMFSLSGQRLITIVVTTVVIFVLMYVIKYTNLGRAITATSQDGEFARMIGVNTKRIYLITYVISAMLAGVAGIVLCPIYAVFPTMGTLVQSKGLVVCVLGGLGSVEGAIVAGILLGLVESFATNVLGAAWKDVVAYVVLIIILYVKPAGLFGKAEA